MEHLDQWRDRVISQIHSAFADVELGNGMSLRRGELLDDWYPHGFSEEEQERINKELEEEHVGRWQDLPWTDLKKYPSAFVYVGTEGRHFYTPALLTHAVRSPECTIGGPLMFSFLFYLTKYPEQEYVSEFESWSREQRAAVAEAIKYLCEKDPEDAGDLLGEAYREYWKQWAT